MVIVCVLLAFSVKAFLRKEMISQFKYLLYAFLGHILVLEEDLAVVPANLKVLGFLVYSCLATTALLPGRMMFIRNRARSNNALEEAGQSELPSSDLVQKAKDILLEL